jgi:hypothetical protein
VRPGQKYMVTIQRITINMYRIMTAKLKRDMGRRDAVQIEGGHGNGGARGRPPAG